jgi:hypothetical protein
VNAVLEPVLILRGTVLTGLNTANPLVWKTGRLGSTSAQALKRAFSSAPVGLMHIAVMHHAPVPAGDGTHANIHDPATVLRDLVVIRTDIVLSGHIHLPHVGAAEMAASILFLQVGTAISTWNKGRIIGQKRPLQPKHVWAIRVRFEIAENIRDLALFDMAIDCKLRGCDLVRRKVRDVFVSGHMKERASVLQSKTQHPVQFEIPGHTRKSVQRWIESPEMFGCDDLWPSRFHGSPHLSTRQYARILRGWVTLIGLEPRAYGTHSMRRTKAAQIYTKTGSPRHRRTRPRLQLKGTT